MNLVFFFFIKKIIYCVSEYDFGFDIRMVVYIMFMEKVYVVYSVGINFIDRSKKLIKVYFYI